MRRPVLPIALAVALAGCGEAVVTPPKISLPATKPPVLQEHFVTTGKRTATPAAPLRGRYITARLVHSTWLRSSPGGRPLRLLRAHTEFGSHNVVSVVARRDGWLKVLSSRLPNHHHAWIPERRATLRGTNYSIHVDRSAHRLTLRHDGRVLRRLPIAVGRPGNETPLGRFAVTDKLRPTDPTSPYGCCALALTGHQTRLVPGWPGGDRLAIHGTPSAGSIGQAVSLGCMRAPEKDLRVMLHKVPLGTPVFIRA